MENYTYKLDFKLVHIFFDSRVNGAKAKIE